MRAACRTNIICRMLKEISRRNTEPNRSANTAASDLPLRPVRLPIAWRMTGASNKAKENGSEEKMPLGNFTSHSSKSFRPFVFIQVVSSVAQGVGGLSRSSKLLHRPCLAHECAQRRRGRCFSCCCCLGIISVPMVRGCFRAFHAVGDLEELRGRWPGLKNDARKQQETGGRKMMYSRLTMT